MIDTRTSRILFTALLFALALAFLYLARHTLVVFLFAIFFAYLIEPLVSRTQRLLRGRGRAIAAIYLLLGILLAVFFAFVGPRLGREGARLGGALPDLLKNVSSGQIAVQIGSQHGWSTSTQQQLQRFLAAHRNDVARLASRLGVHVAEVAQNAFWLILIPLLAAFFLKDGRSFHETILATVGSRPQREFLDGVINDLNEMLAHFLRAQITLAGIALLVYIAALSLMRVPYALVLGTAAGVLEFIPVVGPLVAAILILGISLLLGYLHWLALIVMLGVWRLIQDYAINPRIMGERMQMHPLAAIFGVLAGGEMAGVIGVYLSIPVMASLRIVLRRWRLYAEKKKFGPINEYAMGSAATEFPPRL